MTYEESLRRLKEAIDRIKANPSVRRMPRIRTAEPTPPAITKSRRQPIKAIPTEYKGIRFRSRLEARWARMFDLMNWQWDYEPLDMEGYIPDFVVRFEYAPMLAEIKPAMTIQELAPLTDKIDRSGWTREVMLLGATVFMHGKCTMPCPGIIRVGDVGDSKSYGWTDCIMHHCDACGYNSIHGTRSVYCRNCGVESNAENEWKHAHFNDEDITEMWNRAGNAVQWRIA